MRDGTARHRVDLDEGVRDVVCLAPSIRPSVPCKNGGEARGKPIGLACREPLLEDDVLASDPAEFRQ
jgi:hypothetical protein